MAAQTDLNKISRKDMAHAFGVDVRTITRWGKQGLPKNADATYDLPACIRWRLDRAEDVLPTPVGTESEESQKALTAWRKERFKIARIERLALEGKYVLESDVDKEAFECARATRDQMMAIPDRLDSVLAAESDPHEINRMLTLEVRKALDRVIAILEETEETGDGKTFKGQPGR